MVSNLNVLFGVGAIEQVHLSQDSEKGKMRTGCRQGLPHGVAQQGPAGAKAGGTASRSTSGESNARTAGLRAG